MKQLEIGANEAGQRLDKYLKKLLKHADHSFIYKMLRKKNIVLNGKKAEGAVHLTAGDCVTLYLSDDTFEKFSRDPAGEPLITQTAQTASGMNVLYEDADILILNKPAGMLSQKAAASDVSANEWVIRYLAEKGVVTTQSLQTFRPAVCNRLDRNTSGILIAGKTLHGLQSMSRQFRERTVKKYYRCVTAGILTSGAHLKGYLYKDHKKNKVSICQEERIGQEAGQYIETEYWPVGYTKECTMLEVHLITGRSHQIRAHLASVGHPVIGDPKYGSPKWNGRYRAKTGCSWQLLHAFRIVLENGQEVVAPLPDYFSEASFVLAPQPAHNYDPAGSR